MLRTRPITRSPRQAARHGWSRCVPHECLFERNGFIDLLLRHFDVSLVAYEMHLAGSVNFSWLFKRKHCSAVVHHM
jgi:hypothetical protein